MAKVLRVLYWLFGILWIGCLGAYHWTELHRFRSMALLFNALFVVTLFISLVLDFYYIRKRWRG
jgi:hypothetical protein